MNREKSPTNVELLSAARQRTREEILKRTYQTVTVPQFKVAAPLLLTAPSIVPEFFGPITRPVCRYITH